MCIIRERIFNMCKVTPITKIDGIDLRFRHMTDGKGYKRKINKDTMSLEETSIYDKIPKPDIDRYIKTKENDDSIAMMGVIKSCINCGRIISKIAQMDGRTRYRIERIGEIVSYKFNPDSNTINLMTVDNRNGYTRSYIYSGQFEKVDGNTYICISSMRENMQIKDRGLLEIEV